MVEANDHHHRSGALKQSNKGHKHGKHRSQRSLVEGNKGRLTLTGKHDKNRKYEASKMDRRNRAKQIRAQKRSEAISAKRLVGGLSGASQLVAIIPVCEGAQNSQVRDMLIRACADGDDIGDYSAPLTTAAGRMTTCASRMLKNRFTFIDVDRNDPLGVMEAVKIADTVVFVAACDSAPDEAGENAITCAKAIGLPPMTSVVVGLERMPVKRKGEVKKAVHKFMQFHFPNDERILPCDGDIDALALLRCLAGKKRESVSWRNYRSYVVPDSIDFVGSETNPEECTLKLTGYIRGSKFDVNRLVHIPGIGGGDFLVEKVVSANDPHNASSNSTHKKADTEMGESADVEVVLAEACEARQDTLVRELEPDMMDQEQTFPTEEEEESFGRMAFEQPKAAPKRVPKGTSAYQAAWIVEDDNDTDDSDAELTDVDDMDGAPNNFNDDFYNNRSKVNSGFTKTPLSASLLEGLGSRHGDGGNMGSMGDMESEAEPSDKEEFEDIEGDDDPERALERYDKDIDYEKEQIDYEKRLQARHLALAEQEEEDDMEFPDEIDTPTDTPAHVRFQRYRGLQSFKDSKWDVKESLPLDYSRIFQFEDLKRTYKRVRVEAKKEGLDVGQYVTVYVKNVSRDFGLRISTSQDSTSKFPVVMTNLLRHEGKMTVVNFGIKRHSTNDSTVKNKADLVYVTPLRTFTASTIFSQNARGDKFKMERFLHPSRPVVASVYAPVHFGHLPVVVFERDEEGNLKLLAMGSVNNCNADRVNLKKIVLSGAPFKINVRHAVVRYMFFNTNDISWFKPVELWTKGGLRGHIKETLGTHGHMKCSFNGPMRAEDTVCMSLYKRAYPRWNYSEEAHHMSHATDDTDMMM
eukprot:CFRG2968T1